MSDQTAPEPTMEEILASIRRIISEDDAPKGEGAEAAAPAAMDDEEDDVLELTERAHEEEPAQSGEEVMAPPEPEAPPAMNPEPEPYREPEPVRAYQPQPERQPDPAPQPPVAREEPLISPRAATVAASAFRELSAAAQPPRESRTLEDLAREMLEPMLRQWLDENLPRIVESAVRDEVERISRGRVG